MTTRRRRTGGVLLLGGLVVVLAVSAVFWLDRQPDQDGGAAVTRRATAPAAGGAVLPEPIRKEKSALPAPAAPLVEPLDAEPDGPGGLTLVLTVVDAEGQPVDWADVVVGARSEVMLVAGARDMLATAKVRDVAVRQTDAEGRCTLRLRQPDSAVFARESLAGTSGVWSAAALLEDPREELVLVLHPTALLSGRVVSMTGQPWPGAFVSFMAPEGGAPGIPEIANPQPRIPTAMRTDASGRFVLEVDAPQTLRLRAEFGGLETDELTLAVESDTLHPVVLMHRER
jgi:hypothetical protein